MKNNRNESGIPRLAVCGMAVALTCLAASCLQKASECLPDASASAVTPLSAREVARWLSGIPLEIGQVREAWAAVTASAANGYDEEYPFSLLLSDPGSGVGDEAFPERRSPQGWDDPLSTRLAAAAEGAQTRAAFPGYPSAEAFLEALSASGLQIYWPYSEDWDGETMPLITFDPGHSWAPATDGSVSNIAYPGGVVVDEEVARRRPVWVINRNEDAGLPTPQLLAQAREETLADTRAGTAIRSLTIKRFRAHRNYDSWLAGGSEFWVKCGAVENFTARTEDELRRYSPSVTDFMISVKRKQIGHDLTLNVMLVSNWTDQLQDCAFMILEDDGGKRTTWKATAEVKIKSKVYGVNVEFPYNRNDDIVWRGSLSGTYFEKYNGVAGRFGDVSLTFAFADR